MQATGYIVGSAAAGAIAQLKALESRDDFSNLRTVDLVNAAAHSCEQAHKAMREDPTEARACLIHGASRLLAAADRLEPGAASANVVPMGVAS